jgi:endonuclease III
MATNSLARDFKIPMSDFYSIDISPDVQVRRVFTRLGLVAEGASNEEIIYRARAINPEYPGLLDLPAWQIGADWCRPKNPLCIECILNRVCGFPSKLPPSKFG